ncbi:MAG: hypothetical protein Q4C51_04785, partial [Clostridia bacterium]|nr:hypothetical protein [Clostridia bacterium]
KIVPGSASRSYGIHVAKLAGVPKSLLENAESKLEKLEEGATDIQSAFESSRPKVTSAPAEVAEPVNDINEQLSFFMPGPNPV